MSEPTCALDAWRFAVPRLRDGLNLFVSDDPIEELLLRGPNKGTKTETATKYVLECLRKSESFDGVALPQWEGPVHALALCLDYPQQKLSVQQTVLRLIRGWPHKARFKGDRILSSLTVAPIGEDVSESEWSELIFLSEENRNTGTGARADVTWFDEPPDMDILRELRKAPHANRRGIRLIGNTPINVDQWYPLAEDYGDLLLDDKATRSTLRRVDAERAECRWSLSEVADWVLSEKEKEKLRRIYANDPHKDAREHGDYIDASGTCPFDNKALKAMLESAKAGVRRAA